ncbi:MAG: polysaccharide deacetylase family protein [Bacteroidia bacterium]|nr:polysaccharide deacetylase family protein [Bacteroidia bacterium]
MNFLRFVGCRYGWFEGHFCTSTYIYIIILFALYVVISVGMSFVIQSGYHYKALCYATTTRKICSLTFDDGPDAKYTTMILEILQRSAIPATFFLIGEKIAGNEEIVRKIENEGHLVGNHAWRHSPWFDFLPGNRMKEEIVGTADAIREAIRKSPLLFRPPYGVIVPVLNSVLKRLPYHVIGWNIRSFDTLKKDPEKIVNRILKQMKPGSIILLHDHLQAAPAVLEKLIVRLKENNYQIVPLTELLDIDAYA